MTTFYEPGQPERFRNARAFASHCRPGPGVAQSGPASRRGRRAKQGRPHLKWALSQVALYAGRYSPKSRRTFDRHRGRHRGKAGPLIACEIIAHELALAGLHALRGGTGSRAAFLFGP